MTRPPVSFRYACLPLLSLVLAGCGRGGPEPETAIGAAAPATYIGSEACGICHAAEAEAWSRSHHFLAMQEASAATVLGDFSARAFEHDGTQSTFARSGEEFLVRSNAAGGEPAAFPVAYTFGFDPLQQYLLEMPDGRLQAFTVAWDTRPEPAGGQRWFDLHAAGSIEAGDPLHWTGSLYNWNGNCAECHSTGVIKGYDADSDTYSTRLSELNVGCEACHGPGSNHAASPAAGGMILESVSRAWAMPADGVIAERVPPADEVARAELEVCAGCHSRRSQLTDAFEPGDAYLDGFRPALLTDPLYHADGQIRDEVFVYGSFLQSRMHAAGVTCSDCHEPHSGSLRADGNAVCGQCHLATEFDTPEHHRHEPGAPGARCVDCHMPAEAYMVVDPRRDHSFRVPRPDLSVTLGTPHACADCHEESAEWAATQLADWFPEGRNGEFHYAEALAAGRRWSADRHALLARVVGDAGIPAIVRATALSYLGEQLDDAALPALQSAIESGEPLLELAAIGVLADLPAAARRDLGQRFLTGHPLALRVAAAESLLPARELLSARRQADLDTALAELEAVHRFNADRPEGLIARANLELARGRTSEAEAALNRAIELAPGFTAAYVNLADLYRALGSEADAEETLRRGVATAPGDAGLVHALGLALVRAGRDGEALPLLERAAELDADQPRYAYVYGVALNTLASEEAALESLARTHERFPGHADTIAALATMHRDAGDRDDALRYARLLETVSPANPLSRALVESLR